MQETTTTAPTSSAEILQTTRSPDGGKPANSPVHHPVNILQYLVSNPPAWVIQELLNGTSSPTTLQGSFAYDNLLLLPCRAFKSPFYEYSLD